MQNIQSIIDSLNPPQAEAVNHLQGPLLVLAGAGTGKTRVLTTRLANLIATGTAQPHNIMAVTFTNKAAKELAERVEQLIGSSTAGMMLGTFHALGARILRRHAERMGLRPDFTILDTDDQKRLLDALIKEANIDATAYPARQLAHIISRWKDKAWLPSDVPTAEDGFAGGRGISLYRAYQNRLQALNACDFGDLLLLPVYLLKQHNDILAEYQNRLTHILVDEYQDTNTVQYLWLRLLSMAHKNICVVGDDDQSIYGWRGAQVANILKFEKDFDGAKVVRLEQNYRSTGTILKAASAVISHNDERHSKTLWTSDDDGEKIHVHPVVDDREEARLIADACDSHQRDGGSYTDCAVLFRTAAQTRSLEEQFIKVGVPYVVIGGMKFYERKEIRDAIAYLRLFHNPQDDLAYQRIINVPRRGVGNAALQTITDVARERTMPLLAATEIALGQDMLSGKAKGALTTFIDQLTVWKNLGAAHTPDRLMELILEESGYLEMLRQDKAAPPDETKARMDNLKELVRAMQDYSDVGSFLEHVSLVMDGEDANEDAVRLMTVHASKGLEFDTVFLPGFEDGLFPHQRSLNETGVKGIEEERRLAYVAITRAKRKLVIVYTASRRMYGQFQPSTASRFLQEIPEECLEIHATVGASLLRPEWGSRTDARATSDWRKPAEPLMPYTSVSTSSEWDIGERVFHQKFGYGNIRGTEGEGDNARLTIAFDKAGQKQLVASLAKLQRA
ncbi:MAG: UvrD-helicase domain-containing protein [Alphaproteobacteria bacterium]|nr:UvrD-helicase domain-containing protein [Alphaproteobacteria bacterium]